MEVEGSLVAAKYTRHSHTQGFVDSRAYECQYDDPTLDEMMCFIKLGLVMHSPLVTMFSKAIAFFRVVYVAFTHIGTVTPTKT